MSSNLYFVNWTPSQLRPILNGGKLTAIKPAEARDNYVPYSQTIDRFPSQSPPKAGVWGASNELLIRVEGGGKTQSYDLDDPAPGQADTDLYLWAFPDFIVFSQRSRQVDGRHFPNLSAVSPKELR